MTKISLLVLTVFCTINLSAQIDSAALTQELREHYQNAELPGFAVAIVDENGVLYEMGFGYANKKNERPYELSTLQYLGSVSKTVVGLALVKSIEDGLLSLDTKINDILPFQVINPYFKDEPILIRHLTNHTSSITDTKHYGKSYIPDETFENVGAVHQDYLAFIESHEPIDLREYMYNILAKEGSWYRKSNFLKAKPGTERDYANLNAALTAYIVELVAKMPFEQYCQLKIFDPLKMNATKWHTEPQMQASFATLYFPSGAIVPRYRLITYPDGGLISSVQDLSLYMAEMIKAYKGNSTYLPLEFAQRMLPGDEDDNRAFWGMGQKSRNIGHGGSDPGVQTDVQFNADSKIGRIILCNVNAEDNEDLWKQYREIHTIVASYENKLQSK